MVSKRAIIVFLLCLLFTVVKSQTANDTTTADTTGTTGTTDTTGTTGTTDTTGTTGTTATTATTAFATTATTAGTTAEANGATSTTLGALVTTSGGLSPETQLALAIAFPLGFFLLALIAALIIAIIYLTRAMKRENIRRDSESPVGLIDKSAIMSELEFNHPEDFRVKASKLKEHIDKFKEPFKKTNTTNLNREFLYVETKSKSNLSEEELFAASYKEINEPKNRYKNVRPNEETRVKLSPLEGVDGSDYINANWISGIVKGSEKAYIAAQGPAQGTEEDFWRMVWEVNSSVVLMLTREVELGKRKCDRYWPETKEEPFKTSMLTIHLLEQKEVSKGLLLRVLKIESNKSNKKETHKVNHYQYLAWPDQSVPKSTRDFLLLSDLADSANTTGGPIVVHCSAGIGRTGTFCTIHSNMELLKEIHAKNASADPEIKVAETVIQLRACRANMVQTSDQYEFCYKGIRDGWKRLRSEELSEEETLEESSSVVEMVQKKPEKKPTKEEESDEDESEEEEDSEESDESEDSSGEEEDDTSTSESASK